MNIKASIAASDGEYAVERKPLRILAADRRLPEFFRHQKQALQIFEPYRILRNRFRAFGKYEPCTVLPKQATQFDFPGLFRSRRFGKYEARQDEENAAYKKQDR